jgi:large subunit ribosomal protein L29
MKENAEKARALDTAEIHKQLNESSEQMFRLRFQMSMGQADGLKKLRLMRKERARMLTVLRERELNPDNPAPVKATKASKAAKAKTKTKEAKPGRAAGTPKAARAPKAAAKPAAKPAVKKPAAKKAPAKKASKG